MWMHRSRTSTITIIHALLILQILSFFCPWKNQSADFSPSTSTTTTILFAAALIVGPPTALLQQQHRRRRRSLTSSSSVSPPSSFLKMIDNMSASDFIQSSTALNGTTTTLTTSPEQNMDESINPSTTTATTTTSTGPARPNEKNGNNPNRIQWVVRPATLEDEEAVTQLLQFSYETLLSKDYDSRILEDALPIITQPRPELLTCGTWYVVEHSNRHYYDGLVGCGGWTRENPSQTRQRNDSTTTATATTTAHLRHFATHPDWVRKGVGRAIWNQICQDLSLTTTTTTISTSTNAAAAATTTTTTTTANTNTKDDTTPTTTSTTMLEVYSTLTGQTFYESLGFEAVEPMYISIPLTNNCKFPSILMKREWSA